MRAAVNYVTGSHAFKFGMHDMWGTRQYRYDTNQAQAWTLHQRHPDARSPSTRGRSIDLEHLKAALGVYAQDRWTINEPDAEPRSALRLSQRLCAGAGPGRRSPSSAARHYDAIYNVPNWKDLSPRLGGDLRLFGNGKTVVRGN